MNRNPKHIDLEVLQSEVRANYEHQQSQLSNITNALCDLLNCEPCQKCGKYIRHNSADGWITDDTAVCCDCIPAWYETEMRYLDPTTDSLYTWIVRNSAKLGNRFNWIKNNDKDGFQRVYNSIVR